MPMSPPVPIQLKTKKNSTGPSLITESICSADHIEMWPSVEKKKKYPYLGGKKEKLHNNAITFVLPINSRARNARLLHPTTTLLQVFETFTGLGVSLCCGESASYSRRKGLGNRVC